MLQLFFEKAELSDSVASVRWCVDPDMAREVKAKREKGFQTFAVLFDVLNEQTARESRFIASLDEMMTFISFAGPGKNLVRAIVVYSRRDIREIKADFLDKHRNRRYHNYAMFSDGFAFSKEAVIEKVGRFHCQMLPESEITDMEVIVPEKFFAKKPPRWLWNFVNHYFTGKPFEQCDFRKKALYAIPFGIIVMPIEIIATTFLKIFAALACALFGLRNVYYGAIIHPFTTNVENVFDQTEMWDSYFWRRGVEHRGYWDPESTRHPAFWPLAPIFPVLLIFSFWLFSLSVKLLLWPIFLILGLAIPVAASALILAFHGLAILAIAGFEMIPPVSIPISSQFSFDSKFMEKWRQGRQEKKTLKTKRLEEERYKRARESQKEFEEELKTVTCIGVPLVPRLEALPERAKTIRLRFLNLKARVCRPYAG